MNLDAALTLLAREPENENGVEQLTQLLLDQGKSEEAIKSLQGILERAPTARPSHPTK